MQVNKNSIYTKLNKIDRPVLLVVVSAKRGMFNRYRIIFPDGSVIFSFALLRNPDFSRSCFNTTSNMLGFKSKHKPTFKTLQKSISIMARYDAANNLIITSIIKL